MIVLYDGYVLSNDSIQWILQKENGINKKTGKTRYKPIGYFTRLENALSEFGRRNTRDALENGAVTLKQAINTIKNENERLEKFIRDNIPDI